MLSYCYHSKRYWKKPKVLKQKKGRTMVTSNCLVVGSKKSTFIIEQEASKFLSSLVIKTLLIQIPIVGPGIGKV